MEYSGLCKFAYDYLLSNMPVSLSKEEIDSFISNADGKCNNLTDVFKIFVVTMQDYQSRPRVINFNARGSQIQKILCGFDYQEVLKKYTAASLFHVFEDTFPINNAQSKNNTWRQYAISIIDGAKFISRFCSLEEFNRFVNSFSTNEYSSEALPLVLSAEIQGMGFALACDFLKEMGFLDYPKPDIHLIEVFSSLGLCAKDQLSCYKAMVKTAKSGNMTPYALDKVVWLICTGNYYRYNTFGKRLKEDFIEKAKVYLKTIEDI